MSNGFFNGPDYMQVSWGIAHHGGDKLTQILLKTFARMPLPKYDRRSSLAGVRASVSVTMPSA